MDKIILRYKAHSSATLLVYHKNMQVSMGTWPLAQGRQGQRQHAKEQPSSQGQLRGRAKGMRPLAQAGVILKILTLTIMINLKIILEIYENIVYY